MPRRFIPSSSLLFIALALSCVGARLHAQTISAAQVPTMPDVIGMPQDQAMGRLRALQLNVQTRPVPSAQPRGVVVSQEPAAGRQVKMGSSAVLEVSTGQAAPTQTDGQTTQPSGGGVGVSGPRIGVRVRVPTQVTVPDLTGMSLTMARIRLVTGNLIPGGVDSTAAPGARPGRIVAQDPAPGTVVRPGTRVRMTIANRGGVQQPVTPPSPPRPELVAVPSLAGRTVADARETLDGARLQLGGVDSASAPSAAVGTVVRQRPAAGDSVQPGTPVVIVIARQQMVTVPSVAGMPLAEARRTLSAAGLVAGAVGTKEQPGRPVIVAQSVPAGTSVVPKTVINLTVSRAPVVAPPAPPVVANPPVQQPPVATNPQPPAQPADSAAAPQPTAPATNPAPQPVDVQPQPAPAPPPVVAPPAAPVRRQPAPAPSFPREVLWGGIALLLLVAAGAT
ncbi:MAG TPA: PASTA domain-containing protein, partial [Longimicrobiaceae bacterium]